MKSLRDRFYSSTTNRLSGKRMIGRKVERKISNLGWMVKMGSGWMVRKEMLNTCRFGESGKWG